MSQSKPLRVYATIPCCHSDHVKFIPQVYDAVQANFPLPDVSVDFDVCKEADNSVDADPDHWNWDVLTDAFNAVSQKVVDEKYDYLWIIEADVVIPSNALSHMLGLDVDVACAVVPYHFQNYLSDYHFKDLVSTGFFAPQPSFENTNLYLKDVKDKLLVGSKEHPIFNGTGCILIKRRVFEAGLKWHWDNKVSGSDVYFWLEAQAAGFSAVTDGFVVCEHLGR